MRCPRCSSENREGRRFCSHCAALLAVTCPSCGFSNEPDEMFCGGCAAPLAPGVMSHPSEDRVAPPEHHAGFHVGQTVLTAERRQLTVMFCDLVGSTALSQDLDLEELREVVRSYQQVCTEVIGRFEGHIAQYLGDGVLAYFGYPSAHEDDAQRAIHAGLSIIEAAVGELNARLHPGGRVNLAVRLGVHTGPVVVGEVGGRARQEHLALGETPNLAARLQELAEPNTLVISAATHRLLEGLFVCRDLGLRPIKGSSKPVRAYRVLGESGGQSRLEVAAAIGLTPFVGREQETGLLLERWQHSKEGRGQVVLLGGEAGIGKSRLARLLKERLADEPHVRLECRCSSYHQNSAFYPVVELLHRALGLTRQDTDAEKLEKVEAGLQPLTSDLSEAVPLYAELLSVPLPDRYPPLALSPQRRKQKTLEIVLRGLLTSAALQPILLVVEDLHWIDPSTLELLTLIVDHAPTARMLVLLTFRPDFRPPWPPRSHLIPLTLNRFTRKQTEAMIERVAGGRALPGEVVRQIVAKTDGIPLFVEELTKTVLESGWPTERDAGRGAVPLTIPATLQDSLMARLDRLGRVKEVAQLAATLGREFTYELLQAVCPLEETALLGALDRLVDAELLYKVGLSPQTRYVFKHALVQDVAYQSLLTSQQQRYHAQIAQALDERFPEIAESEPELVAHHYTEAGLGQQGIVYWQRAGRRAIERSANVEAIRHLTRGLELVRTVPDTPERTMQELLLQTALGSALMATKGYAAAEVEKAYGRALELCRQIGETSQTFRVLAGLSAFHQIRGDLRTTHELGRQLLTVAESDRQPAFLLLANNVLAHNFFFAGEFVSARACSEQAMAFLDPQKRRSPGFRAVQDTRVVCLSNAAWILWFLGYPERALESSRRALALATELSQPFSLATALYYDAWLRQFRRDRQSTQERAEAVIALSTEQGFPHWAAGGAILRGWAHAEEACVSGRDRVAAESIEAMRQGLAAWQATGAEIARPYYLALLAEAYGGMGRTEEGLVAVAEALDALNKNGERFYEADLYRLKGVLTLRPRVARAQSEAEECFRRAIEIARRQGAKSLELRAVTSLSRLWQQLDKRDEARQMLTEIHGWFTEGFDTVDHKEAEGLVRQLA